MSFFRKGLLSAAAGIAMVAGFASSASATLTNVTLDPTALGYTGFSSLFTTASVNVNSDSLVIVNSTGTAFTETGVFVAQSVAGPGPTQTGLGINWGMGGTFSATGTGSVSGGVFTGGVSSFNITLFSTDNNLLNISMAGFNVPSLINLGTQTALGSGSLFSSQGASISSNTATISATTDFTVAGGATPFFVAPSPFQVRFLESITTNSGTLPNVTVVDAGTAAQCTAAAAGETCYALTNVSGPIKFDVPEPGTLAMFGVGLLGLGLAGARQRRKAA